MYCPVCRSDYPADWKACPKDATLLLESARIGKYLIEGLLGTGGMGAVYRATNPDTQGRVAVKVMNPSVASAESARQRFQREAAAVAALRTAHVVKVFDFGAEPDGTLYLVMELLDGHPLRDEIRPGPDYMDLGRVQMVMDGALRGLAAAHRAGIVHRDLKPENVFVAETDDGEVPKLLDFGIARVQTRDSNLTRTGSLMGTASYMASEQVSPGVGEIGPWTDVYAMGAILYEMLSGAPAFGGQTVTEVLQRVLSAEVAPLASVRAGLPDAVYDFVATCMSAKPAQRPQDAEAMRRAMEGCRFVPAGWQVPPAFATRAEASTVNVTPLADSVAIGPTVRAPGAAASQSPSAFGATAPGLGTVPTTPSRPPVTPEAPAPIAPRLGQGSSDVGAHVPLSEAPPRKRTVWPFVVGGVLVVGGVVAIALAMRGGGDGGAKHHAKPDAAIVARIDAAPAIDAAVVVAVADAAPVEEHTKPPPDLPKTPKPPDTPKPPEPPKPEKCDRASLDEAREQARSAYLAQNYAQSIAIAERVIACNGDAVQMHVIVVMAACSSKNAAKAKQHLAKIPRVRQGGLHQVCARNGIEL